MNFCPQCHLLLSQIDCDGVPIQVCGSCGGCWFRGKILDELISNHSSALADLDSRFPGGGGRENYAGLTAYCPDCRTEPLTEWNAPGVSSPLLDCPKCEGVWARSGLRVSLAESGNDASPADQAQTATIEEIDEAVTPSIQREIEPVLQAHVTDMVQLDGQQVTEETKQANKLDYLAANEKYASGFVHGHLPRIPARKLVIITCMDARMQVYEILGLKPGDANILRNAGGIVTEDVLRSLIVSHHLLGTQEIIIINHTDCGLLAIEEESFRDRLTDETGSAAIVPTIFHAFKDLEKNVRTQVLKIRSHPWIPRGITVRGFVYDVRTGRLTEVN